MKNALLQFVGFLAGYGLSLASSIAFFQLSGRPPYLPQPMWFMVLTAVYGIAFSVLAGYAAASIGTYSTGFAVAVTIFVLSILSLLMDKGGHWSQFIALVLMAPATVLGAKLRSRQRAMRNA